MIIRMMPEIYASAVAIMKDPANASLFNPTNLTGNVWETTIQNFFAFKLQCCQI